MHVQGLLVQLAHGVHERTDAGGARVDGHDRRAEDGDAHAAGQAQTDHHREGERVSEPGQRGRGQFGTSLVLGQSLLFALGGMRHDPVVAQQERAHVVHAHLKGRGHRGEEIGQHPAGPQVFDPGHRREVALLGHAHHTPAARRDDQEQHGQQCRIEHGQHTARGDQRQHAVDRRDTGTDHVTGFVGPELGPVDQLTKRTVLDRRHLDPLTCRQVLFGRGAFDLRLQAPGCRGGPGGEQRVGRQHDGRHHHGGQRVAQAAHVGAGGDDGVQSGVDGEQLQCGRDALAHFRHSYGDQ
ncbi:hypothetical protein [Streptomyces sp. NPDC055400]